MALSYSVPIGVVTPVSNALTTTGADTLLWCIQPRPDGGDATLNLSCIGTGAVPTAVTVDVEQSTDNQLTWQKYATAKALVTGGAAVPVGLSAFPVGPLFRVNATTVTLGSASAVKVFATLN